MVDESPQHGSGNPPGDRPPIGTARVRSKDAADLAGGIEEMVREIRTRLTEISSRELELRRREQEFERQYARLVHAARRAAEEEISADQEVVERERRQLTMRMEELTARRAQVESRAAELRNAVQEIERRRLLVTLKAEEVDRRLQAQRMRHRRHRQALRRRIGVVRERERELGSRLQLAHAMSAHEREELVERERRLEAREQELAALRQDLERGLARLAEQEAEVEHRARAGAEQGAEVEQLRAALRAQGDELEAARDALATAEADLAAQQSEIAERCQDLEQRRQALDQRTQAAEQQHQAAAAALDARRAALERDSADLAQRAQRLAGREQELALLRREIEAGHARLAEREAASEERCHAGAEQAAELERQRAALEAQAAELGAARDALSTAAADVTRQQAELAEHEARLDAQDSALEQRRQEAERRRRAAEEELASRRDALERDTAALAQRARTLADGERSLAAVQPDLKQRQARLAEQAAALEASRRAAEARAAEIEALRGEVEAQSVELAETRAALETAEAEVARQREELAERQRETDERWQDTRECRQSLAQATEDLAAQRRALESYVAELAEREQRVEAQEAGLDERLATLQTERANLEGWSETLAQRQAGLQSVEQRLQAMERDALHLQQEAEQLHAAAQARDERSRRAASALDTERNALDTERAALEAESSDVARESAEIDAQRAALEDESAALAARRAALERECDAAARQHDEARREHRRAADLLRAAQAQPGTPTTGDGPPGVIVRPRRAALRGVAAAVVVGAVAAGATWLVTPPRHEATVALEIATSADDPAAAVAEHCHALLDAALLTGADVPPEAARQWQRACRAGRVQAVPLDDAGTSTAGAADDPAGLRLVVWSRDFGAAERLARLASTIYADRQNRTASSDRIPPGYEWLRGQHTALAADFEQARRDLAAAQERLAALVPPESLPAAAAAVESIEGELAQTAALLEEARARIATLVATEPTRGAVDPAAVEDALRADAIHVEDRNEFRSVALRYRTELAVNALQMTDPIRTLDGAIEGYAQTVREQRELDPPPEIAAVLENVAASLATAGQRVVEFREGWGPRVDAIKDISIEGHEIVTLVERQNELANAARRVVDANAGTLAELHEQVAALDTQGAGSTRAVVVGAVLRGEQAELEAAQQAVHEAAGRISLADNFELDALDRQLRGLRVRLQQRREWITQQLQLEADRDIREAYAADVATARAQVRTLEQDRERLVARLAGAVQELGRQNERQRAWADAAEAVSLHEARVTWLEARVGELSETLRSAQRRLAEPDRVAVGAVVTSSGTAARGGRAALAGLAAFALTGLACGLMVAGTTRVASP